MMNSLDPFNAAKSHAIDIHFEAFPFDILTVASRRFTGDNKLSATIHANVILFTFLDPIFTDMG